MNFKRRLALILCALSAPAAMAVVTGRTQDAAEELHVSIIGEVEFAGGETRVGDEAPQRLGEEVRALCSSTTDGAGGDRPIDVTVVAWADREYPDARTRHHSRPEMQLAERRARNLERAMARASDGALQFTRVNMATRADLPLAQASSRIKHVLEINGAAPTSPYEIGLFGEYAQSHKVLLLTDCGSSVRTRHSAPFMPLQKIANVVSGKKRTPLSLSANRIQLAEN